MNPKTPSFTSIYPGSSQGTAEGNSLSWRGLFKFLRPQSCFNLKMQPIILKSATNSSCSATLQLHSKLSKRLPPSTTTICYPSTVWSIAESGRIWSTMLFTNSNSWPKSASPREKLRSTASWKHSSNGAKKVLRLKRSSSWIPVSTCTSLKRKQQRAILISTSDWTQTS